MLQERSAHFYGTHVVEERTEKPGSVALLLLTFCQTSGEQHYVSILSGCLCYLPLWALDCEDPQSSEYYLAIGSLSVHRHWISSSAIALGVNGLPRSICPHPVWRPMFAPADRKVHCSNDPLNGDYRSIQGIKSITVFGRILFASLCAGAGPR